MSASADAMSEISTTSAYAPCINEPFIAPDASEEEKAMHAFLDAADIFQINVKAQMKEEQKLYTSPITSKLSMMRAKNPKKSPSFMERRASRLNSVCED